MKFTKDFPKVEGWYWYRNLNKDSFYCQIEPIFIFINSLQIESDKCFTFINESFLRYNEGAEFCGPMELPRWED